MPQSGSDNPKTPGTQTKTVSASPAAGSIVGGPAGGELLPVVATGAPLRARAGGVSLDVGQDVTEQLDAAAPAFGNVLLAIGNGLASSQKALDQGVIDAVNTLNNTKIKIVTDVVEVLGDDGLPDASKTELVTKDVSVLNFFTPTVHEWKNVSIAMDLSIGSFHEDQGLQFRKTQHAESATATGLFWGFLGWFDTDDTTKTTSVSSQRSADVAWQSGQLRVDALLGPRKTGKLPVPAAVSIGPQIFVSQGAVTETKNDGDTVTARTIDVEIEIRKADGSANPQKNITLNSGGLLPSFPDGSATGADGKMKVTLTRTLVPGFTTPFGFQLSASLGQLRKPFTVTL